jgi:hypothetical protein
VHICLGFVHICLAFSPMLVVCSRASAKHVPFRRILLPLMMRSKAGKRQLFLEPLWCPPSGWQHGMNLHVPAALTRSPAQDPGTTASASACVGVTTAQGASREPVPRHLPQRLSSCPRYRELDGNTDGILDSWS